MPLIDPLENSMAKADMEVVTRARALVRSHTHDPDHVMCSRSPSWFDLIDSRMLVSGGVAVVMGALVELNRARHVAPLDALDLALRMVALGAAVRATIRLVETVRRFRSAFRAKSRALVLLDDALVVLDARARGGETVVPRSAVVGAYGGRRDDGSAELFAFVAADGRSSTLAIDLVGDTDPAIFASRIKRWSGHAEPRETSVYPPPSRSPAEDFDRITRGELRHGETTIRLGRGWLARGPFAAGAFVAVLAERAAHLPAGVTVGKPVVGLALVCVALPLIWLAIGLRRARAAGGAAAVITPAELLVRNADGIHRAPFDDVLALTIAARRSWTLMGGLSVERSLVVERASSTNLTFDERWTSISVRALAALLETYGEGVFASETPASQGSAAGGGISSTGATTT